MEPISEIINLATLLLAYLSAQGQADMLMLAPWHLWLVTVAGAVLSGFGLHFLLGHLGRFYMRTAGPLKWISVPTGLMLIMTAVVLAGCYLLTLRMPVLVQASLDNRSMESMGALLFKPALDHPSLSGAADGHLPKEAVQGTLSQINEQAYRDGLTAQLTAPGSLLRAPRVLAGSVEPGSGGRILNQLGLHWVMADHDSWRPPTWAAPATQSQQPLSNNGTRPFLLADFLGTLINEIPPGVPLPRNEWEHIAGVRFSQEYLEPVLYEYFAVFLGAVAGLVLLLDVIFLLLVYRIKRIGMPRKPGKGVQGAAKVAPKDTPKPQGTTGMPLPVPTKNPPTKPPATTPVPAIGGNSGEDAPAPSVDQGKTPSAETKGDAAPKDAEAKK